MSSYVVVLTTFPADRDVTAFARALVEARLAACVNVLPPMESIYRWKTDIETATERQLVIKTTQDRLDELQQRFKNLHPYDIPEFVVLPVADGSPDYLAWISENTTLTPSP